MNKFRYIGFDKHYAGTTGEAAPATGHNDPESAEFQAWMFQPDGEEIALYCSRDDLETA
jgi:hypothetical protein